MSKVRVHEIAKMLGKSSKDIISDLKQNGVEVQSHMSTLVENEVDMLRKLYTPKESKKPEAKKQPAQNRPTNNKPQQGNNRPYNNNNNQNRPNTNNNQNRPNNNTGGTNNNQNRPNNNTGGTNNNQNRPNNNTGGANNNRPNTNNQNRPNNNQNRPYNNANNANRPNTNNQNRPNNNNQNRTNTNTANRPNANAGGTAGNTNNQNRPNNNNQNRNNNYRNNYSNRNRNRSQTPKPKAEPVIKNIVLPEIMTIKELGDRIKTPAAQIVKKLFLAGVMATVNQEIEYEQAAEIALEYNYVAELEEKVDVIEELLKEEDEDESYMVERPPVVCVMGHVDHGKTSLLDAIRSANVTTGEAGGITQHIGAYVVSSNGQKIAFLDTPGHEAFTSMRMRGAQATDIAILVVAADDGVMPQTIEAINHAKAAGIEIIVAINKIDKESANIERVKQELMEHELVAEDWGGSTIFVPVSAHTRDGIPELLEMILLTSEVLELKANPKRNARGIVIEAKLDKARGPVTTVLVQKGTLKIGDSIAVGDAHGKVRAMTNDKGKRVKEAGPSTPVEILGLNDVPNAGDIMIETDNEKEARSMAEQFIAYGREKMLADTKARLSLDDLFEQIQAGNVKDLNLVVKADVQGSVEALKQSLLKLSNEEVMIKIIHSGVGAINESDVILASASNAIIIGFNVRPDVMARTVADSENVDLRLYKVIYSAIEDIEAAMTGMLDPIFEEKVTGHVEIRQVYKASGIGNIAGSYVLDGLIKRGSKVRISRQGKLIHEGNLASLKRFKDDVKEVKAGYECGLVFEDYNEVQELDIIEAYIMVEVPR